jgi:hypothetical protein
MPARQAVFAAAILLGCAAAQAAASPLISLPLGAFAQSNKGVQTVRWRHRHYRDFWSGRDRDAPWSERADNRGDSDASSASSPMRSLNSATPGAGSEIFGPQFRRRGGWVVPPPPR